MIQAMYSGISGMKAFKSNLDVIGNNIANVNTTGYKSARATFKEMLSQTINGGSGPSATRGGTNPSQIGLGVIVGSIDVDQTQGSMQASGRQTDVAIEGNGYLALSDGQKLMYTRDGALSLDAQHNLVSSATGMKVAGWSANSQGIIDTKGEINASSAIQIPIGSMSIARQTTQMTLTGNLDASKSTGADTTTTYNVFDSLGLPHKVEVKFIKADNQTLVENGQNVTYSAWDYEIYCPDADATDSIQTGTLLFDSKGFCTTKSMSESFTFSTANGSVQPLVANLDVSSIKQMGGESKVSLSYQDGLRLGTLEDYEFDRSGIITGKFTNGSTVVLGQIAIADFSNPAGLVKSGNNLLAEGANSGPARLGVPGEAGRGSIAGGFLEASNVDLANEFASMIVAQRGFEANSKIITVSDEVLQTLVNLKR